MFKKLVIIAIVIWLSTIFYLSHMEAEESGSKTTDIITISIEKTAIILNKEELTDEQMDKIVKSLHTPVRKVAHGVVYAVLAVLVMTGVNFTKIKMWKKIFITLLICIIYAVSDEFHQNFVSGRTPYVRDVIIDAVGAIIGIITFIVFKKIIEIRNAKSEIKSNKK